MRASQYEAASFGSNWSIEPSAPQHTEGGVRVRGRGLDLAKKFLPDQLSLVDHLVFLSAHEQRLLSQVQGRTYANMFGLFGQRPPELFRRIERTAAQSMPPGYRFTPVSGEFESIISGKSTWTTLGFSLNLELVAEAHHRASIAAGEELSPLFQDAFDLCWQEQSPRSNMGELEWIREDCQISADERDAAVDDLANLVHGIDGLLQGQAHADADYFMRVIGMEPGRRRSAELERSILKAYRLQAINSGFRGLRFQKLLAQFISEEQLCRMEAVLVSVNGA
jgi:hypothetical protein